MKTLTPTNDVLVLHANNEDIADWICELTRGFGLKVMGPINVMSSTGGKERRAKLVLQSRLILVLHAFDESLEKLSPGSGQRLDEWKAGERARIRRIQLIESRNKPIERSGVDRINFTRAKLEFLAIDLVRAFKEVGLVQVAKSRGPERMTVGTLLNAFLDKMDKIWDKEFDPAALLIPGSDARAEREFGAILDDFFLCYWRAIREVAGNTAKPKRLAKVFDAEHSKAQERACHAWEVIALANQRHAEQKEDSTRTHFDEDREDASILIKQAKSAKRERRADLTKSMDLYKEAAEKLHHLLGKEK